MFNFFNTSDDDRYLTDETIAINLSHTIPKVRIAELLELVVKVHGYEFFLTAMPELRGRLNDLHEERNPKPVDDSKHDVDVEDKKQKLAALIFCNPDAEIEAKYGDGGWALLDFDAEDYRIVEPPRWCNGVILYPSEKEPQGGVNYYYPTTENSNGFGTVTWRDSAFCRRLLESGLLYGREYDAQHHRKAMGKTTTEK